MFHCSHKYGYELNALQIFGPCVGWHFKLSFSLHLYIMIILVNAIFFSCDKCAPEVYAKLEFPQFLIAPNKLLTLSQSKVDKLLLIISICNIFDYLFNNLTYLDQNQNIRT